MRVVSLRLRLLAAFVDAATVGSGMAACIGSVIAGVVGYSRLRGDKGAAYGEADGGQHDDGQGESDAIEDDAPSRVDRATRGSRQSPELQVALRGASAGLAIASRNWRTPGFRLIGLRRVDAHTGGGVTVRSALAGVLFDEAWQSAWRPLFRSRAKRHQTRLRALAPQLRAVERNNRGSTSTLASPHGVLPVQPCQSSRRVRMAGCRPARFAAGPRPLVARRTNDSRPHHWHRRDR